MSCKAKPARRKNFLLKNPNGKVPLLELPDGRYLPESNAGLYYLASNSALLPQDHFERAQVLQWMFFEQYSHEPHIAVARYWWTIAPGGKEQKAGDFKEWHSRGYQALDLMENHLKHNDFFAANRYTIADIALYAYTHVADEGGFDLAPYKTINAWLDRVKGQDDHVDISWRG